MDLVNPSSQKIVAVPGGFPWAKLLKKLAEYRKRDAGGVGTGGELKMKKAKRKMKKGR
jgi:hypothetical protein